MSDGITGNFDELADASTKIGALEGMPDRMAQALVPEFANLLDQQFALGVDPYGDPWAALAPATIAKGRHNPPLTDSGLMHASASVHASNGQITMTVEDPAGFHQTGTRDMPEREILPTDARGLPPAYELAIRQVASDMAGFDPEPGS